MKIFDLQGIKNSDKLMLGSYEYSGNFTGEFKLRIFNLLGENKSLGLSNLRKIIFILLGSKLCGE